MPLERYYEGDIPVVDDDQYRKCKGIVLLEGRLWDSAGKVFQEFQMRYSRAGKNVGHRIVSDDGSVSEA